MFSGSSLNSGSRVWLLASDNLQDLARRQARVDHLDARAMEHDLLHGALVQVERAQKAVALFLLHRAFLMAERQRAHISSWTETMLAPASIRTPEKPQYPAHQNPHHRHDRRHDP